MEKEEINSLGVKDEDGREWAEIEDISQAFVQFYQALYTTEGSIGAEDCLEGLEARVTPEMNAWMLRPFVVADVETALSQMHPLKSPGPDGFATCFYQKAWDTIRNEVCTAVLEFLNGGGFDADINNTYIALIPKVKTLLISFNFAQLVCVMSCINSLLKC